MSEAEAQFYAVREQKALDRVAELESQVREYEVVGWYCPEAGVIESFEYLRSRVLENFNSAVPLYVRLDVQADTP